MSKRVLFLFIILLGLAVWPPTARAAEAPAADAVTAATRGAVSGTVKTMEGEAVAGATVRLVGTTRSTLSDASGTFHFSGLPPGRYLVQVESGRYGANAVPVTISSGATAVIGVSLDVAIHSEKVVVTAKPEAAELSSLVQPVGVLVGDELVEATRPSLGETLADQPGVSQTFFGEGASRPVIRGEGGDRVRILENGLTSEDASDTSPDHAVALEPLGTEKIEVVRGPATLLYGSNAIGGVVNIIDNRIPDHLPTGPVAGALTLVGSTNSTERNGAAEVSGAAGPLAWTASGFNLASNNYYSGQGMVQNSDLKTDGGSLGLSWIGDDEYLGISARHLYSNYGDPSSAGSRIDLHSERFDLAGAINREIGIFTGLRLKFDLTDYNHSELDYGVLGTLFTNDSWEARLDGDLQQLGPFHGSAGVDVGHRQFSAIGEEAFVPPDNNHTWAAFLFEEAGTGSLRGQFGVRQEVQDSDAVGQSPRHFAGTSASIGGLWQASDAFKVSLTLADALKIPDPEQLYANGPHPATNVWEIGDPNLQVEKTLGLDLTFNYHAGRVQSQFSLFANKADNFIYDSFTGQTMDNLTVVQFKQANAQFYGGEAQLQVEVLHASPHHLEIEFDADTVHAELVPSGEPLPRITPTRLSAGLRYQGAQLSGSLFVRRTQEQDRVAPYETTTKGFTMINCTISHRFFQGNLMHEVMLVGDNLTNQLASDNISYLKDIAPLPGRDVRLTYKLVF